MRALKIGAILLLAAAPAAAQSQLQVLHTFTRELPFGTIASFVRGSDGNFYGVTIGAGQAEAGSPRATTIFRMTPNGTTHVLHTFPASALGAPSATLMQASDGNFYGTVPGRIFRMSPRGEVTTIHTLATADQGLSDSPLIEADDGHLYGRSPDAIYRVTFAGQLTRLRDLPVQIGELAQGRDRHFYFTGNDAGRCVLFRLTLAGTPTTLGERDAFTSQCPRSFTKGADGELYGLTATNFFRLEVDGNVSVLRSFTGSRVSGRLVLGLNGQFFATSSYPDSSGNSFVHRGVVRLTTDGAVTEVYYSDQNQADERIETLAFETPDGQLYGWSTVQYDLPANPLFFEGRILRLTPGGTAAVLRLPATGGADGGGPRTSLLLGTDGNYYGHAGVTIFRIGANADYEILHRFATRPLTAPRNPMGC